MHEFLQYELLRYEKYALTVFDVIKIAAIFLVIQVIITIIGIVLARAVKRSDRIDKAKKYTIMKLVRYFLFTVGIVLSLQTLGVNISGLLVGSAALLVGIGLGLQNVFSDFVSGFVILFEGTVKVGDVIEVDGMPAKVMQIDIRTTKVIKRDGNYIIIPNSLITGQKLNNWSMVNKVTRFQINVGVAYGTDTTLVKEVLLDCAQRFTELVDDRHPRVDFVDFGDSALMFRLYFWAERSFEIEVNLSDLRLEIDRAFREKGISIPFPQRDLHVRTFPGSLQK